MWKVSFSVRKSIDKPENRMQELNICFDFQENYFANAQIRSKMKSMNLNTPERWVQLSEHN